MKDFQLVIKLRN